MRVINTRFYEGEAYRHACISIIIIVVEEMKFNIQVLP